MVASNLAKTYDVSFGVLKRRILKEIELGNLTIP